MFDGRSGAGRKEYRWKRASASVFVRFFGKRTGSSASSNSTSAQESAPAMAVSAAGAPLGSEQMDFENSALGELAEEDMLDGMGGLCYDSDEMYDEEEKGEGRQGVPTDLFGVGEASAGPSALTRDEGEVLGAGVGTGATGGNAGATGAGASASAGELPAPPACDPGLPDQRWMSLDDVLDAVGRRSAVESKLKAYESGLTEARVAALEMEREQETI
jgi:hypothetical protein